MVQPSGMADMANATVQLLLRITTALQHAARTLYAMLDLDRLSTLCTRTECLGLECTRRQAPICYIELITKWFPTKGIALLLATMLLYIQDRRKNTKRTTPEAIQHFAHSNVATKPRRDQTRSFTTHNASTQTTRTREPPLDKVHRMGEDRKCPDFGKPDIDCAPVSSRTRSKTSQTLQKVNILAIDSRPVSSRTRSKTLRTKQDAKQDTQHDIKQDIRLKIRQGTTQEIKQEAQRETHSSNPYTGPVSSRTRSQTQRKGSAMLCVLRSTGSRLM